jgi:hypothetical protein
MKAKFVNEAIRVKNPKTFQGAPTEDKYEKGYLVVYSFNTWAKDNEGRQYPVYLTENNPDYNKYDRSHYDGMMLSIHGTPGMWYVFTLLHVDDKFSKWGRKILSLDYGSRWDVVNFDEILDELIPYLENNGYVVDHDKK